MLINSNKKEKGIMTCYKCQKCSRYFHISKMGEFNRIIKIRKLKIKFAIWLCKWCMTKAGIKYKEILDWVEVEGE